MDNNTLRSLWTSRAGRLDEFADQQNNNARILADAKLEARIWTDAKLEARILADAKLEAKQRIAERIAERIASLAQQQIAERAATVESLRNSPVSSTPLPLFKTRSTPRCMLQNGRWTLGATPSATTSSTSTHNPIAKPFLGPHLTLLPQTPRWEVGPSPTSTPPNPNAYPNASPISNPYAFPTSTPNPHAAPHATRYAWESGASTDSDGESDGGDDEIAALNKIESITGTFKGTFSASFSGVLTFDTPSSSTFQSDDDESDTFQARDLEAFASVTRPHSSPADTAEGDKYVEICDDAPALPLSLGEKPDAPVADAEKGAATEPEIDIWAACHRLEDEDSTAPDDDDHYHESMLEGEDSTAYDWNDDEACLYNSGMLEDEDSTASAPDEDDHYHDSMYDVYEPGGSVT
jgi:hypothetical protein